MTTGFVLQGHVLIQACVTSKVLTSQLYLYSTKSLDNVNSDHTEIINNKWSITKT